jgi:DNA-binding SARP family transcriptional activator
VADSAIAALPQRLKLLGGFSLLREGEEIVLPTSAQRVVALLALRDRPLSRGHLARVLWPDCSAERSLADLRTALWRVNQARAPLVTVVGMHLRLHQDIHVDVRALLAFGRAAAHRQASSAITELAGISWPELALDLLPDWDDDWLLDDRERIRQLRLHALESMTEQLSGLGLHVAAIEAALAAVAAEPLRETAHAALIRAHLAEGNRSEALRQFHRCQTLLAVGLAIEPSEAVRRLIADPAAR